MDFVRGSCFWLENSRNGYEHFHIAISKPVNNVILVVNISHYYRTPRPGHVQDTTCLLSPGEHECVRKPSLVKYSEAFLASIPALRRQLELGLLREAVAASNNLLRKIQEGAKRSPFLKGKCKAFFQYFD